LPSPAFGAGRPADDGGAVFSDDSLAEFINCTFYANYANDEGGAFYNYDYSDVAITNCILWGNDAGSSGEEVYNDYSEPVFRDCCVEDDIDGSKFDGDDSDDDGGNISSNPCFVDAANDDFHLASDSPCIDAGDSVGDYSGKVDIDGEPRVMNGLVDMGADEETGGECKSCKGDLTDDGWITTVDVFALGDLLVQKGSPYEIDATDPLYNDCGDMDEDDWLDPEDYNLLNIMLGQAGPPYEIECP